jgi:hypothetical protein
MDKKDLIEEIKNQGPNWKRCVNVGVEIDQFRGQIKEIESFFFFYQLRVKMHKFTINDQNKKDGQLRD